MTGLLHVPFFGDELLTSYLSRMARANGRMEMRPFLADLGLNARGIVRGEPEHANKLEEVLCHQPGALRIHGFSPVDTRHVSTRRMVFPSGSVTPFAARFCPECLDEDSSDHNRMSGTRMYGRFQWALRCVSACHRHQQRLVGISSATADRWVDIGQFAGAADLARDFCSLAEYWISTSHRRKAQETPYPSTGFERFAVERLGGKYGHGRILDAMPLPACIDACGLVGSASRFGRLFRLPYPGGSDERAALAQGFDILAEGEEAFRSLLDRLAGSRPADGPGFHGSLSTLLGQRPATHDPLKAVLRAHAQRHIATMAIGNGLNGDRTSVGVVAASVGLPPRTVARYLIERGEIRSLTSNPAKIVITTKIAEGAVGVLADDIRSSQARFRENPRGFEGRNRPVFAIRSGGPQVECGPSIPRSRSRPRAFARGYADDRSATRRNPGPRRPRTSEPCRFRRGATSIHGPQGGLRGDRPPAYRGGSTDGDEDGGRDSSRGHPSRPDRPP
jgi:hypothetical protein